MTDDQPFWRTKTREEMTREEWDSLCDGCAKCCVHKYEDEDTGDVYYTNVACEYLDPETCRCREYRRRKELVPDCATLYYCSAEDFRWLPPTCAYRLLAEGKDLPEWHPLVTGDPDSTRKAGMAVGLLIPEDKAERNEEVITYTKNTPSMKPPKKSLRVAVAADSIKNRSFYADEEGGT